MHWTEKLRDGTHVLVRPIRKSDASIERTFIERLSPESRHFRFLGYFKSPSDELVKRMTDIDDERDMAFVALVHDEGEKKEVGVSRYSVATDGTSCECAVAVADEWHGRGLGALLMRHLIEVARSRGIKKMCSIDSSDNSGMRDLAAYLGFKRQTDPDDVHQVLYTLSL
ncbi:MAG: GNAT family N-acetyltransferase [Rudaea sp.]|nr:GNAT family N-acetyltransferase [Rudaea sp.]